MNKYKNGFLIVLGSIAALGAFLFGYDTAVIGAANLFIHYDISPYTYEDQQLVTSILTLGAAIGALLGGCFSDRCGRKPAIFLSDFLFIGGASLLAAANSVGILVLGRIIIGLGVGMAANVVPVYLSQTAPTPVRGRIITMYQLLIVIGGFLSYIICYLLNREWRVMFGMAVIPAFIQAIGMIFMPESPRWLLKYSRDEEAMQSFSKIYNLEYNEAVTELDYEIQEIKAGLRAEGNLSYFQQLKGLISNYYRGVIIGDMLFVIQQFSGINTIFYYGPNIIMEAGFGSDQTGIERERKVLLYSIPLSCVQIVFTIIMFFLIDRRGRRYLMLRTLPFMGVFMFLLAFSFYFINVQKQTWAQYLTLFSMGCYLAFFALGMGATPYAVNAEIYPLPLRATANSLAITSHWISNYVVAAAFLSAIKTTIGSILTYAFLGLCCMFGTLFIYKFLPETKGIPLPDIVKLFHSRYEQNEGEEEDTRALIGRSLENDEANET